MHNDMVSYFKAIKTGMGSVTGVGFGGIRMFS